MSIIKSGIIVVGISLVLAACSSAPIVNVNNAPISTGKSLQATQVRQAITIAGAALGWQVTELKPGLLQGTLRLREHQAVVEIPYTTSNYSIVLKSSVNLGERDGQIHKNYNSWVQNLDNGIRAELARL